MSPSVPPQGQPVLDAKARLERLYRDYGRDVYRLALRDLRNREDAEDATQAAFLNAYRALVRGDSPRKPRSWLLAIAANVCRRRFRAGAGPSLWPLDQDGLEAPSSEEPEPLLDEIVTSLGGLPETQRSVLVLRELGDLSYAEISERVGLSVQAVQMQLFRARRRFRQELSIRRTPLVLSWLPRLLDLIRGAPATSTAIPVVAATLATGVFVAAPAPAPKASAAPAAGVPTLAAPQHAGAARPGHAPVRLVPRVTRVSPRPQPHLRAVRAATVGPAPPQPERKPEQARPISTAATPGPEPAVPPLPVVAPRLETRLAPPPVQPAPAPLPPPSLPAPAPPPLPAAPKLPVDPPKLPAAPKLPDAPALPAVAKSKPAVPPPPVTGLPAPSP